MPGYLRECNISNYLRVSDSYINFLDALTCVVDSSSVITLLQVSHPDPGNTSTPLCSLIPNMKNLFIEREKKNQNKTKPRCIYGQEKDNAEVSSCHLIGKQNENVV